MKVNTFDALRGHDYVNLLTYRKNGTPVKVPVWFAIADGHAYVWTDGHSYKVKRLRNNPSCALSPCNISGRKEFGPAIPAKGTVVEEGDAAPAIAALRRKYGLKFTVGYFLGRFKPRRYTVFLDIVPVVP